MHGRKRESEANRTADELRARAEKIAKYSAAKAQLLAMRASKQYDSSAYALTSKLIEINPDFYTLFNFRKEIVESMWTADPSSKASLSSSELDLSAKALLKNPKCYSAWYHRLWVLDHGQADAQAELALCDKMLQMDARNFHTWNYRRSVASRANADPQAEFDFTTRKINENFSNYSAWHYRTVLIPKLFPKSTLSDSLRRAEYMRFLNAEFELVRQAFFTEPEDQSAWLYHRWLLGRVIALAANESEQAQADELESLPILGISLGMKVVRKDDGSAAEQSQSQPACNPVVASSDDLLPFQREIFERELSSVDELLSVEEKCKWALLTSAILVAAVVACRRKLRVEEAGQESALLERIQNTFQTLVELDPFRAQYYKDVEAKFLQHQQNGR